MFVNHKIARASTHGNRRHGPPGRPTGHVALRIYDAAGREVATLVDGARPAGKQTVAWSAESIPSGVYLAELETATGRTTRKLVLLR